VYDEERDVKEKKARDHTTDTWDDEGKETKRENLQIIEYGRYSGINGSEGEERNKATTPVAP